MKNEQLIYGARPIIEAIEAGKEIEKLFIQKSSTSPLIRELLQKVRPFGTPIQMVPVEKLNSMTRGNHQGVVAFLSMIAYQPIEEIVTNLFEKGKNPFILVLDRVTDVRNFGAIARTAECAGVDAIVIPDKGAAQINADALKTAAGALTKLPVCRTKSLAQTTKFLKDSGLQIFAVTEKGNVMYDLPEYRDPLALIMGSEDQGIASDLLRMADHMVRIPLMGKIGSLNVSVAAGILMFEVVHQRSFVK
ncbi:MAG: 23S rRNA (guanosine(2251)-2'-O)-methyltransferase RlmB [Sphingobacteriia bacterium]|jgi:23S rRNA (guanosine2251-2'-O)-methyltransferase|nr:23S rRNA (guanosine(2251)-2'-O)-methyltransferase RlmB [Sphingobacteriia bacterium]HML84302.1 23S rRNA (guanosine(2251)-2'-O)-methyltransferase RlmB [Bacteroidales bacterium]